MLPLICQEFPAHHQVANPSRRITVEKKCVGRRYELLILRSGRRNRKGVIHRWRFEIEYIRVGVHRHTHFEERNRQRNIKPIGYSVGGNNRELMHFQVNTVLGRNDVVSVSRHSASAATWSRRT